MVSWMLKKKSVAITHACLNINQRCLETEKDLCQGGIDMTGQFHTYERMMMVQTPIKSPKMIESRRRRDLIIPTRLLIPGILSTNHASGISGVARNIHTHWGLPPFGHSCWKYLFSGAKIRSVFHMLDFANISNTMRNRVADRPTLKYRLWSCVSCLFFLFLLAVNLL
jgi:hypothetical protein